MQIVIVGMHRSGTSLLARIVNLLGAYVGTGPEMTDKGVGEENPKGFWERSDVRKANEALLAAAGCAWDRVLRWDGAAISFRDTKRFSDLAGAALLALEGNRPWAIKDPRFCLTIERWMPLLELPKLVFVLRDPLEVAVSLQTRNRFPIDVGLALWEKYFRSACKGIADHANAHVATVTYGQLLADPISVTQSLIGSLETAGVRRLQCPSDEEVSKAINCSLYRSKADHLKGSYRDHPSVGLYDALVHHCAPASSISSALSERSAQWLEQYERERAKTKSKAFDADAHESNVHGSEASAEVEAAPYSALRHERTDRNPRAAPEALGESRVNPPALYRALEAVVRESRSILSALSGRSLAIGDTQDLEMGTLQSELESLRNQLEKTERDHEAALREADVQEKRHRELQSKVQVAETLAHKEAENFRSRDADFRVQLKEIEDDLRLSRDACRKYEVEAELRAEELRRAIETAANAQKANDSATALQNLRLDRLGHELQEVTAVRQELQHRLEGASAAQRIAAKQLRFAAHVVATTIASARWRAGNAMARSIEVALGRSAPSLAINQVPAELTLLAKSLRDLSATMSASCRADADCSGHESNVLDSAAPGALPVKSPRSTVRADRQSRTWVDVVVCVHNAPDETRECLHSLMTHSDRFSLIIVDDGSDVSLATELQQFSASADADVVLFRNENALGYTRAANIGLRSSSAPLVILLNSDCVVTPGWLDAIRSCFCQSVDTGIVGPWSNAASWQSVPELKDQKGGWCVNDRLLDMDPTQLASLVRTWSADLAPEVSVVNGFCYAIARQVLETVGYLDEESFPRGYGEEDDYSIRAAGAGFKLRIADSGIVLHKKSRSFTSEGRNNLVKVSKERLKALHGPEVLQRVAHDVSCNEELVISRAQVSAAIRNRTTRSTGGRTSAPLTIAWLQPHLKTVGGIRRCVEMANRLMRRGHEVHVLTPDGSACTWLPLHAKVGSATEPGKWDVLILSDPDMVSAARMHRWKRIVIYHLAAYCLYREKTRDLEAFYTDFSNRIDVANSTWTAEQVRSYSGRRVEGVFPGGIDKRLFRPMRAARLYDVVYYGSARKHKGSACIERALSGLTALPLASLGAAQRELATHICSGSVFASGAWHEGFNFCPLEAMACGVPVVMTDCGGSREYAVHGVNAIVVPVEDERALRAGIDQVLNDKMLRVQLIANGLDTAWRFDWDAVTDDFCRAIEVSMTACRHRTWDR